MGKSLFVGLWIVLVTLRDIRAADEDLSSPARWEKLALLVRNGNLRTGRHTHRAHPALPRGQWIAGYLVGGLHHPVSFNDRYLEEVFEFRRDCWRQRGR